MPCAAYAVIYMLDLLIYYAGYAGYATEPGWQSRFAAIRYFALLRSSPLVTPMLLLDAAALLCYAARALRARVKMKSARGGVGAR